MKSDEVYLKRILEAVDKVELFTAKMDKEIFISDAKTQSAVIMQLALIGELSKKISPETKTSINLPWKDIAGFRDRAIHDYFEVDIDVVWNTVLSDIVILKNKITKSLEKESDTFGAK